jgi:hypothetical protein
MTAYCAIMTLLLAFFIILQAFATVREEGMFYAGRGSFVRALETFGLGGVWERAGGRLPEGQIGPRYRAPEGQDEPSGLRRIDAEREEAQRALRQLEKEFDVREPRRGTGWRVTLPTPFSYMSWPEEFTAEHEAFCEQLAQRLEPLIVARGFVIRIGAIVRGRAEQEAELSLQALRAARSVRGKLMAHMAPPVQARAATRVYSFCRRAVAENGEARLPVTQLRVDIMLTKPYVEQFNEEGAREIEQTTAS